MPRFSGQSLAGAISVQRQPQGLSAWGGATVAVLALLGYPLIAAAIGPGLGHAEAYGLHPDPTAVATLGVLLVMLRGLALWLSLLIPSLWCVIGSLSLMAMDSAGALIPLSAAILIAGTALARSIRSAARIPPDSA